MKSFHMDHSPVRTSLSGVFNLTGGLIWLTILVGLTNACDSGDSENAEHGDGATDVATQNDVVISEDTQDSYVPGGAPLGESYYSLQIVTSEGQELLFERDLTLNGSAFSFGSTHLAPPALTLAINDTLYDPTFMVIELNFGFLVGNVDHTVTTPDAGEYPFKAIPPYVELEIPDLAALYSSKPGLAAGKFVITEYSQEPGGVFAGEISGTLVESKLDPNRTAQIVAEFRFVLPNYASGGN